MCDCPDDLSIRNDERLLRRVLEDWVLRNASPVRPTSATFKDRRSNEVSVFIAALTSADTIREGHPNDSVAEITAGEARAQGFKICRDPAHGLVPNDPSHLLLCAPTGMGTKARLRAAKALVDMARWAYLWKEE